MYSCDHLGMSHMTSRWPLTVLLHEDRDWWCRYPRLVKSILASHLEIPTNIQFSCCSLTKTYFFFLQLTILYVFFGGCKLFVLVWRYLFMQDIKTIPRNNVLVLVCGLLRNPAVLTLCKLHVLHEKWICNIFAYDVLHAHMPVPTLKPTTSCLPRAWLTN